MRFIHTADIHLDSPLLNLNQYDGAPVEAFRQASRQAFENLVELAVDEKVDFVLVAGDLYDRECRDMNTPVAFRRSLQELVREGIGVYVVQGNHDADAKVTKAFKLEVPEGVHLFSTRSAKTQKIEPLRVAIHGQGFATGAVEHSLVPGYPKPVPGWFNIGLLHTNCGSSPQHGDYAPSTVPELVSKGYDYWALGHIHQRQYLRESHPWIVYPGNIQGRHARETGEKGCVLVEVEDDRVVDVAFHALDVVRWERLEVDVSECRDGLAVTNAVMQELSRSVASIGDRLLAVRIDLAGATQAHRSLVLHASHFDREIREAAVSRFDERVWVEKIRLRTTMPPTLQKAEEHDEALAELLRGIDADEAATEALEAVGAELEALRSSMPTDPRVPDAVLDLDDPQTRARLIAGARDLIVSRLLDQGGAS